MLDKLKIRRANENDSPFILEIYNEVVGNSTAIYEESPRSLEQQTEWYENKCSSGFPIFVGDVSGKVAAYASYGPFRQWFCYRYTVEVGLHVSKEFRGRGIGKEMLAHIIADAKEREFHSMISGIDKENIASIRLHEKFDFIKVAELPQVGFKFNRWLDLIFMQLKLNEIGRGLNANCNSGF